jgi:hypothetical protein
MNFGIKINETSQMNIGYFLDIMGRGARYRTADEVTNTPITKYETDMLLARHRHHT